jgi:hypothetical protein
VRWWSKKVDKLHRGTLGFFISKKEFLRWFSQYGTALPMLGISVMQLSQGVAQHCAVLQQKIFRP